MTMKIGALLPSHLSFHWGFSSSCLALSFCAGIRACERSFGWGDIAVVITIIIMTEPGVTFLGAMGKAKPRWEDNEAFPRIKAASRSELGWIS